MVGQIAPDLVASQSDSPIADKLARRLARALPPQIQQSEGQQQQIPPQFQRRMQALSQQHEQLVQVDRPQASRGWVKDQDNATKLQIAAMQERTKLLIAMATLQGQAAKTQLESEISVLDAQADRDHDMNMQALQAQQAMQSQRMDQQHQMQMAECLPLADRLPAGANPQPMTPAVLPLARSRYGFRGHGMAFGAAERGGTPC